MCSTHPRHVMVHICILLCLRLCGSDCNFCFVFYLSASLEWGKVSSFFRKWSVYYLCQFISRAVTISLNQCQTKISVCVQNKIVMSDEQEIVRYIFSIFPRFIPRHVPSEHRRGTSNAKLYKQIQTNKSKIISKFYCCVQHALSFIVINV